jgi:hypothetical protein
LRGARGDGDRASAAGDRLADCCPDGRRLCTAKQRGGKCAELVERLRRAGVVASHPGRGACCRRGWARCRSRSSAARAARARPPAANRSPVAWESRPSRFSPSRIGDPVAPAQRTAWKNAVSAICRWPGGSGGAGHRRSWLLPPMRSSGRPAIRSTSRTGERQEPSFHHVGRTSVSTLSPAGEAGNATPAGPVMRTAAAREAPAPRAASAATTTLTTRCARTARAAYWCQDVGGARVRRFD